MKPNPSTQKVIVALSGGVDSSVSAYLLQQQGYQVEGLFMKNWEEDDTDTYCSAANDIADAEAICQQLKIPFHVINFATEYWDNVFEHFLHDYQSGRTPNPDILCNREIKFKMFRQYAETLGADAMATGHYARIECQDQSYRLLRGQDANKDQSYFLYTLGQQQLAYALFPVGELQKSDVRKIAAGLGLANHAKKDSTGICFIGERKFKQFLAQYLPAQPGSMVTVDGQAIASHDGLMYYTIGQRKGLGIGGHAGSSDQPWFVIAKDLVANELIVKQGHDCDELYSAYLTCSDLHWISGQLPQSPYRCTAKVRYRQTDVSCELIQQAENLWRVNFAKPEWAVTPGQSIVFYSHQVCLGGATIIDCEAKPLRGSYCEQ